MAGPEASPDPGDDASARMDLGPAEALARRFVREGTMPSIVFGAADARGVLGIHAFGGSRPAQGLTSIYFLASLTKAIVATAVMQYVDEGRWDLHAPLGRYLPGFDGSGREAVTAWHILTHTSGLADMSLEELRRKRPDYACLLADCRARVPRWPPGSRYEYNSAVWVLLAETMATLSGMPFDRALRLRLTGRLGMLDTTFDPRYARRRVQPVCGVTMRNRLVARGAAALPRPRPAGRRRPLRHAARSVALRQCPPATATSPGGPSADGPRSGTTRPAGTLSEAAFTAMAAPQTTASPTSPRTAASATSARPSGGARRGRVGRSGTASSRTVASRARGSGWTAPAASSSRSLANRWEAPDEPTMAILEAVYEAQACA